MRISINIIAKILLITAFIGLGISYGPIYLFHIIAAVFAIWFFSKFKRNVSQLPLKPSVSNLFLVLFSFVAWSSLSILWAENKILSIYNIFYFSCGFIIVIAALIGIQNKNDLKKIIQAFGIIVGIEIIIALLESLTAFRFPISPYSNLVIYFNRHIAYDLALESVILDAIMETPTGFRWNPNNLAVTMMLIIPFFLFQKRVLIKLIGSIAAVAIILFTGSRGVLIAMVFMSFFYFVFYIKRRERIIVSLIIALALGTLFMGSKYFSEKYKLKIEEISTSVDALKNFLFTDHEKVNRTSSIAIRQNLMKNGMEAFYDTYGLGVGARNSIRIQKEHTNTHHVFSMHNFWVEILVEAGIIGLALFAYFYVLLIIKLIRIKRTESGITSYVAKAASLSLIGFSVGLISISSAVYFLPMWIVFSLGLAVIKLDQKRIESNF